MLTTEINNNGGEVSLWERRVRVIGTLVGQIGFPILVATFLLFRFEATLSRLTETLVTLSTQIAILSAEQERTAREAAETNTLLRSLRRTDVDP